MESCVKFPSSTPIKIVELYRKLDLQRRKLEKKRIYTQGELLKEKQILLNNNQETKDKDVGMIQKIKEVHYCETKQGDILETDDMEEGLADSLIENLNQHTNVLMEEEISEQHTEMLPEEKEALSPYVFYFNNCFVSTGFIAYAGEDILNIEIELIRRIMMKVSKRQPVIVKQRKRSKRKTTEDYENIASGVMQHKV